MSPKGHHSKEKVKGSFLLEDNKALCNRKARIFVLDFEVMISCEKWTLDNVGQLLSSLEAVPQDLKIGSSSH
jgi:hypothetical protein